MHSMGRAFCCRHVEACPPVRRGLREDMFHLAEKHRGRRCQGHREQVCLPYDKFLEYAAACMQDGKERRLLSISVQKRPEIEFRSRRRLREVAENKTVRKKFGRFLDRKLGRLQYKRIVLSDDCEPYSFGFTCYTAEGSGLCGGIILHRQGSLKSASYGMHT